MPYQLPSMPDLLVAADQLDLNYQGMQKTTFWWRTKDPMRDPDIKFIQLIANNVKVNQSQYVRWESFFQQEKHSDTLPLFMKYVIAGAFFYVLTRISSTYADENTVKGRSALASLILTLFQVDKVSDIPADELGYSLEMLLRYLNTVSTSCGFSFFGEINWHEVEDTKQLIENITNRMVSYKALCSSTTMQL